MLLLLLAPQPVTPQREVIDTNLLVTALLPALNAKGATDLEFWTLDELHVFVDEAAQRLARTCGVFVAYDTSLTTVANEGAYSLPAFHVATLQADLAGSVLRAANIAEIEALDASWPTTSGPPKRFAQEGGGLNTIVIYPAPDVPSSGKAIGLVEHVFLPDMSGTFAMIPAPTCIREYFSFSVMAAARAKETKGAMPEVAQWFGQLTGVMEQIISGYWGQAQ